MYGVYPKCVARAKVSTKQVLKGNGASSRKSCVPCWAVYVTKGASAALCWCWRLYARSRPA